MSRTGVTRKRQAERSSILVKRDVAASALRDSAGEEEAQPGEEVIPEAHRVSCCHRFAAQYARDQPWRKDVEAEDGLGQAPEGAAGCGSGCSH